MTKLWEQHSIISEYLGTSDMTPEELKSDSIAWLVLSMFLRGNERTYGRTFRTE